MKSFFKKYGIILFCLLFFLYSAGFTAYFLFIVFTGNSVKGEVTHRTHDSKRSNITIEYEVDDQNYTLKKRYGRNSSLTVGDDVKVFYKKNTPDKGYIIKDCTSTVFIALVSGALMVVVLKAGKKKNSDE